MSLVEIQHSLRQADQAIYNAVKAEKRWELWEKATIAGFAASEIISFSEHLTAENPSSYFPWMVGGVVSLLGSVVADYKKDSARTIKHTKEKEIKNLEWQKRQEINKKSNAMNQDFYSPSYTELVGEDFSEEDGGIQEDGFNASEYKVVYFNVEPNR